MHVAQQSLPAHGMALWGLAGEGFGGGVAQDVKGHHGHAIKDSAHGQDPSEHLASMVA